jgi:hypothetical protein
MIDDADIFRAAKQLTEQHGENAATRAGSRALFRRVAAVHSSAPGGCIKETNIAHRHCSPPLAILPIPGHQRVSNIRRAEMAIAAAQDQIDNAGSC